MHEEAHRLVRAWERLLGYLDPGLFHPPLAAARLRAATRGVHPDLRVWLGLHGGGPPDLPAPGIELLTGLDRVLRDSIFDEEISEVGVPILLAYGERVCLHADGRLVTGRCDPRGNWAVTTWAPDLTSAIETFAAQLDHGEVVFLHETGRCWDRTSVHGVCVLSHVPDSWTQQVRRSLNAGRAVEIEHIGTFAPCPGGARFVAGPHFDDFTDATVVVWPGVGMLERTQRRSLRPDVAVEGWSVRLSREIEPAEPLDARTCRRSA